MLANHSNDPKLDLSYGGTDETNKYSDVVLLNYDLCTYDFGLTSQRGA